VIHEHPSACDATQNTLDPSFVYHTYDASVAFASPFVQSLAELLEVIHFSTLKPFQVLLSHLRSPTPTVLMALYYFCWHCCRGGICHYAWTIQAYLSQCCSICFCPVSFEAVILSRN
jgi:hypothetical protein